MANDTKKGTNDAALTEEIRSACMQMVNLLSPNLNLNLHDIAMNTGVLAELMNVLQRKGVISSAEQEEIYRNATQEVSALKQEHFKRLGEIDRRKRDAIEAILGGID